MATQSIYTLIGDKAIIKAIKNLQRKDFSKATRAGSKIVKREAQASAPVLTGALKKAIKVRSLKSKKATGHNIQFVFPGGGQFYGHFVEYGTKEQPAQEFVKEAADNAEVPALRQTADTLMDQIEKTWNA